MASSFILRCIPYSCEYPSHAQNLVCDNCGGPLEAIYDYEKLRSTHDGLPVDSGKTGVWRYSPLLPLNERTDLSLGEGGTPLVPAKRIAESVGLSRVFVKDDSRNPTLSFKDRKSTVAVSKAAEFGAKGIVNMTAGNAGSSVAAYASRAGIPAYIFTMAGISEAKLAKLLSYGAHVFRTSSPSSDLMTFVDSVAKRYGLTNMTAASRYNPYVKEGSKTLAFELLEQMGGSLPEWLFVPIGAGGNIAGIFKGLKELRLLGLAEEYPRLVGVQGEGCAPVVQAFERGLPPDQIPVISDPHTIAHSILDGWAPDGDQALFAIRETNGSAIEVSDQELLDAMKALSGMEGIYVEPAAAAPLAALRRMVGSGKVDREDSVVLLATGSGSNQPDATMSAWGLPPVMQLDLDAFGSHLASHA